MFHVSICNSTFLARLGTFLVVAAGFTCALTAQAELSEPERLDAERLDEEAAAAEERSAKVAPAEFIDLDAMIDGEGVRGEILPNEVMGDEIREGVIIESDSEWRELNEGEWNDPWDAYQNELNAQRRYGCLECLPNTNRPRSWQILPEGLIYHSYLAGANEPRMASQWFNEKDEGWLVDNSIGGRIGLLRNGTKGPAMVQGFQVDFEAAAFLRQDLDKELDVVSTDFRAGVPFTFGIGRYQTKIAYYHLSSHLGDEFLEDNDVTRINFARDVIVWGHSYYLTDDVRIYGEAGWAFYSDGGSDPWEFQFGLDYSPACAIGPRGAPFFALNAHLREEVDFGGNFVAQAGWQWRRRVGGPIFRAGAHYYNGKSPQFSFFNNYEHQLGLGIWYDF